MALVNLRALWMRDGMWGMIQDLLCANVKRWEGRSAWMYLDSVGVVTVADGRALFSVNDALALPFELGGRRATKDEVGGDFARVQAMEKNHLPAHYSSTSSPTLSEADMDAMLVMKVGTFYQSLVKAFERFEAFPYTAQEALFDMAYECGVEGVAHRFPHLDAAVKERDWAACAKECHRNACSEARNAWTVAKFLEAAENTSAV